MHKLPLIFFITMLIGGMAACKTDIDADLALQADKEKADIMTYAASNGLLGTTTTSGLYYVLKKADSSMVSPAYGQELEFNYKLYVLYGPSNTTITSGVTDKLLDSTYADSSVYYPFFANSLRPGLEEGFKLMHEGDQATFLMPSTLAFGTLASKDGTIPANSPVRYDVTLKRSRTEDQQMDEYITKNKLAVTEKTTTGLRFIKTVSNPSGMMPTATQTLVVNYKGKLLRTAAAFDSTLNNTYSTSLGKSALAGFNEGLAKLKTGEKATIIFPSSLGYKTSGAVNSAGTFVVPPYAPLRFDIELVSAQ
ncbi:FKBP-type peptidyl-prolyl cis-trans isomerase [Spirosoma sp. KNUC1025]|uniref:FKBP-type peptidyl-prolyl cis-trans isomerase n=1 Tax=Spirosoma sp. KNUC1025 TaxID=2894082 RepID=UPI003870B3C9|nr:FKBP-type peptidyl-prolyl cis-trans isomerase [Spirosoma sp. KNUC1025]